VKNAGLEGMRGAAAVFVVLFHLHFAMPGLDWTENGYLAVDLFFVLSGYVIGGAYRANVRDGAALSSFIVRRFGRIWPVHVAASVLNYVLLMGFAATIGAAPAHVGPSIGEALAIVLLAQGLNTFDHNIGTNVSWSTSDEFYVYMLFGLLCRMAWGWSRIAAFASLALIGYALAIWASVGPEECLTKGNCFSMSYSFGWSRCLAGFFFGALIAEYRNSAPVAALAGRVPQCLAFAVALLFVLFVGRVPGSALAAPFVFAALIASMSSDIGPVARIFQTRAAQYFGRLSYSLYLAHAVMRPWVHFAALWMPGPVAHAIEGAAFLLVSLALAHILCERIETPCRRWFNARADRAFSRTIPTFSESGSDRTFG
jgi:peptidoglycan/LPS O-acetylase OafA/YrhL